MVNRTRFSERKARADTESKTKSAANKPSRIPSNKLVKYNPKQTKRASTLDTEGPPCPKRRRQYGFTCKEKNRTSHQICGLIFDSKIALKIHVQDAPYHWFDLLRLPVEIRIQILRHVIYSRPLVLDKKDKEIFPKRLATRPTLELLLANHQLHEEAIWLVCAKVDFLITGRDFAQMFKDAERGKMYQEVVPSRNRLRNFQSKNEEQALAVRRGEMAPLLGICGPGTRLSSSLAEKYRQFVLYIDPLQYPGDMEHGNWIPNPTDWAFDTYLLYQYRDYPGRLPYNFLMSAQFVRHFLRFGSLSHPLVIELFHSEGCTPTSTDARTYRVRVAESLKPLRQLRGIEKITFGQDITDLMGKRYLEHLEKHMRSQVRDRGNLKVMTRNLEELIESFDPNIPSETSEPNPNYWFGDTQLRDQNEKNLQFLHRVLGEVDCEATFVHFRDQIWYQYRAKCQRIKDVIDFIRKGLKEKDEFHITELGNLIEAFSAESYDCNSWTPPARAGKEENLEDWQVAFYKMNTLWKNGSKEWDSPNSLRVAVLGQELLDKMEPVISRVLRAYDIVVAEMAEFDRIDQ